MTEKTLTLALMDPPYESANSTTALRLISAALKRGMRVNVFAYEGAVSLPLKEQTPHANPVKGTSVEEEEHPTTRAFVSSLLEIGGDNPLLTWVNCGLCVDERGAANAVALASEQELQAQQMTKSMQVMMPLMIAYFAVVTPAGLGLYWFISNCVAIIQQYFVTGWGQLWRPGN